MPMATDTVFFQSPSDPEIALDEPRSDRRADVLAKQEWIAAVLRDVGCEGLLVLLPENFTWLTSGAIARGVLDANDQPALYFNSEQRWLLACNVDSQRIFDEELDGLGFQLKEWPWHWRRDQLLGELCHGKKIACDFPVAGVRPVGEALIPRRRQLSQYEQACLRVLGDIVSHALEATCRNMVPGQTEREVAGQLGHRLLHRGAQPIHLAVAADGRLERFRRGGFTATPIERSATVLATAKKYGLHVTASRTVCFGEPDGALLRHHDAACKIHATYLAASWPDAMPGQLHQTARRIYQLCGYEHEWLLAPPGFFTGRLPVEAAILPKDQALFQVGWAVTWQTGVGSGLSCDTFLLSEDGPREITPAESWPMKRIRVQGAHFFRPDLLRR